MSHAHLRRYRIYWHHNDNQAEWLPHLSPYFRDVCELGKEEFDNFRQSVSVESRERPWRRNIARRAITISAKAERCLNARKNEFSWRLSLESDILARFSIEVSCSACRSRLWRSELEVATTTPGGIIESLKARQARRTACQCPIQYYDDLPDDGLNEIFDDRADERVRFEDSIEQILDAGRKPDRLIGLRPTKRLDRILYDTETIGGQLIIDAVETSPFDSKKSPLLFPFLVLEAKSEISADSFSNINDQTSFAIRALLKLQQGLKCSTNQSVRSGFQPVVWFFANKGELWRVYGGYVKEVANNEPEYHISKLWSGDITAKSDALQLLLIVDYVFDWARDIYRKSVINALLSLAGKVTHSLAAWTDVGSTRDLALALDDLHHVDLTTTDDGCEQSRLPDLLQILDRHRWAIRDAGQVTYKTCALFITSENLKDFVDCYVTDNELKTHAGLLWRSLRGPRGLRPWCVTAECLNMMETIWTNASREATEFTNPHQPFLVVFDIASRLTDDITRPENYDLKPGRWRQAHELTYVAIAIDTISALREHTQYLHKLPVKLEHCPRVPLEWIETRFKDLRSRSVRQCLLAAITRQRFTSLCSKAAKGDGDSFAATPDAKSRANYYKLSVSANDGTSFEASAEAPWKILRKLRIGRPLPRASFLRTSQQKTQQHSKHDSTFWAETDRSQRHLENANVFFVRDGPVSERPSYCVFFVDMLDTTESHESSANPITVHPKSLSTELSPRATRSLGQAEDVKDIPPDTVDRSIQFLGDVYQRLQNPRLRSNQSHTSHSWKGPRRVTFEPAHWVPSLREKDSLSNVVARLLLSLDKLQQLPANQWQSLSPPDVQPGPRVASDASRELKDAIARHPWVVETRVSFVARGCGRKRQKTTANQESSADDSEGGRKEFAAPEKNTAG